MHDLTPFIKDANTSMVVVSTDSIAMSADIVVVSTDSGAMSTDSVATNTVSYAMSTDTVAVSPDSVAMSTLAEAAIVLARHDETRGALRGAFQGVADLADVGNDRGEGDLPGHLRHGELLPAGTPAELRDTGLEATEHSVVLHVVAVVALALVPRDAVRTAAVRLAVRRSLQGVALVDLVKTALTLALVSVELVDALVAACSGVLTAPVEVLALPGLLEVLVAVGSSLASAGAHRVEGRQTLRVWWPTSPERPRWCTRRPASAMSPVGPLNIVTIVAMGMDSVAKNADSVAMSMSIVTISTDFVAMSTNTVAISMGIVSMNPDTVATSTDFATMNTNFVAMSANSVAVSMDVIVKGMDSVAVSSNTVDPQRGAAAPSHPPGFHDTSGQCHVVDALQA